MNSIVPVMIALPCCRGEGFCVFNDIACAAHVAMRDYGLERILVVDLDVHQVLHRLGSRGWILDLGSWISGLLRSILPLDEAPMGSGVSSLSSSGSRA